MPQLAPKPPSRLKPAPLPRKDISVKELYQEAAKGSAVIPGTGGKMFSRQEQKQLLDKWLPYKKVGSYLNEQERKNVLRQIRREDKGNPSRGRRFLEEKWGLKGKY